jgi:hypothetical protein
MSRGYQRTSRVTVVVVVAAVLLLCPDAHAATTMRTTPIVVRVEHDGFRFADAAVGAAAGAGAVLTAAGCLSLLRLRREQTRPPQGGARQ